MDTRRVDLRSRFCAGYDNIKRRYKKVGIGIGTEGGFVIETIIRGKDGNIKEQSIEGIKKEEAKKE